MSAGFGIGREVRDAIILGFIGISICVAIGSTIAQSLGSSHGAEPHDEAGAAHNEAPPTDHAPTEEAQ